MSNRKIGFIGAGQMAQALSQGGCDGGVFSAEQIVVTDVAATPLRHFIDGLPPGARTVPSGADLVRECDVIVLAVKPQHIGEVATELGAIPDDKLIVSIAAGVRLAKLTELFRLPQVARVMPNTPCLVGQGAAAYCCTSAVAVADRDWIRALFESVGVAFELPERLMDAVTGLSGSGPAFVFTLIEGLADGGVRMGLPRDTALQLATQTFLGAAALIQETHEHPALLRDRVASPGGTTMAGLFALEQAGVRAALMKAVEAATCRSQELGD